jgi:ArsR family transcriptional regulator, arsenate/arsenite/antimonite-responsive transcriptional repressor
MMPTLGLHFADCGFMFRNMSKYRNDDIERFAAMFKALANPNRLRIFLRLVSCGEPGTRCDATDERSCIGDLGANLGLAPSTISHHIKELKTAGLLGMERSGQRIECWVPREVVTALCTFMGCCCTGDIDGALGSAEAQGQGSKSDG